jgi:DNA-binding SARP family transcriptional activator
MIVRSGGDSIWLDPDLDVDVRITRIVAEQLRSGGLRADGAFRNVAYFSGDLLPDWYDDWLLVERERFRQLRLHALERLSELLVRDGRVAEAVDAGLQAVAGEPLRESAQRALIVAYLAEGNRAAAVRQYDDYRLKLRRDLDIEPGPELAELLAKSGVPTEHRRIQITKET